MSDFDNVFDLNLIISTSTDMPDEYCLLSDTSRIIILQLLSGTVRYRHKWLNSGDALTDSQWDDALALVDLAVSEVIRTMLVGTIIEWSLSSIPDGFLECDGSAIDRSTQYGSMLVSDGCPYGAGDGSTTVNIPNRKGRVSVGLDTSQAEFNTMGLTGGEKAHQLTETEMPIHNHTEILAVSTLINSGLEALAASATPANGTTGDAGGDGLHNNLQPYLVTKFIVKV